MRQIVVRYEGDCRKCGASLAIGENAIYERRIGLFCLTCAPVDSEDIRKYRQEAANKKADKYDEWAAKRKEKAEAVLSHNMETYRGDHAFNTQPGHIPARARVIRQDDKAFESLQVAHKMEQKAAGLRHVRVEGDAERSWQKKCDEVRAKISIGSIVNAAWYGKCEVLKINKKTARLKRLDNGHIILENMAFLKVE